LKSYEEFVKLLCDDGDFYHLYVVEDDNDAVAYVLLYKDELSGFLWIDYIAVFPEYYSKGYGRKIIAELKNTFSKSKGVYFEVEKPDTNSPDTLRRIKFYTSCGVKKLDCEYFYPNKDGCLPMDLYFLPIKNEVLSK